MIKCDIKRKRKCTHSIWTLLNEKTTILRQITYPGSPQVVPEVSICASTHTICQIPRPPQAGAPTPTIPQSLSPLVLPRPPSAPGRSVCPDPIKNKIHISTYIDLD